MMWARCSMILKRISQKELTVVLGVQTTIFFTQIRMHALHDDFHAMAGAVTHRQHWKHQGYVSCMVMQGPSSAMISFLLNSKHRNQDKSSADSVWQPMCHGNTKIKILKLRCNLFIQWIAFVSVELHVHGGPPLPPPPPHPPGVFSWGAL